MFQQRGYYQFDTQLIVLFYDSFLHLYIVLSAFHCDVAKSQLSISPSIPDNQLNKRHVVPVCQSQGLLLIRFDCGVMIYDAGLHVLDRTFSRSQVDSGLFNVDCITTYMHGFRILALNVTVSPVITDTNGHMH
jgi:hypothetical protein